MACRSFSTASADVQAAPKMADVKVDDSSKDKGAKHQDIVLLNVGGKRFATSRQTLTWIPDSFFTSLMSGGIPSLKDESGAIFIDRDPESFGPILNFMRTRSVDLRNVDLKTLRHEAEFFGLLPLVKRLMVCDELERSNCGSLLFYCQINPPVFESLPSSYGLVVSQHEGASTLQPAASGGGRGHSSGGIKPGSSRQALQLIGHGNCIAIAYSHCICVLGVRESRGWEVIFSTPLLDKPPQRISLNTRSAGASSGEPILAAVVGYEIRVWTCSPTSTKILASFDMKLQVDGLFFIGKQLVAISNTGKVVVWQSVQRHWQLQEVEAICSYDTAGSFLLLGCTNGSIYYVDMQKFPVRMKDNDLLVTQLFEDPCKDPITALSVYVTPNIFPGSDQNWMEVAYGTQAGAVRVVVRHPENIGQAPQIFQSYSVHTCPIMRVVLGERHLISVCSENHVRSWTVTRFRGRISTQPGSTPIASFKVLSLEGAHSLFYPVNSIGPFGERDEEQVFIQRVIPETDTIFVRSSSTGKSSPGVGSCRGVQRSLGILQWKVCKIESVDGSNISAYYVHECDAVNRSGLRSRRFIFTGHTNGSVQVWDLTSALELAHKTSDESLGGPSKAELLELLQNCDISPISRLSSALSSRAPSPPLAHEYHVPGHQTPRGRGSIPASPLSTPLLNSDRWKSHVAASGSASIVTPVHPQHQQHHLFQPIGMSQSSSSTSFNEGAASKDNGTSGTENSDNVHPPVVSGKKSDSELEVIDTDPLHKASALGREEHRQKSSSAHIEEVTSQAELSIHQRSRSNEIDYFPLHSPSASGHRHSLSAFRTPSDSTRPQTATPGETSSKKKGSNHSMTSPVHSPKPQQHQHHQSPTPSIHSPSAADTAAPPTILTEQVQSCSEAADVQSSDDVAPRKEKAGHIRSQSERYSWLKDFDSPLWSNYFTTDADSRYSDC